MSDVIPFVLNLGGVTEMPNWVTEVIGILVGAFLAAFFFWVGYRSSEKVREMTERIDIRTEKEKRPNKGTKNISVK
jgi:hypothetical protein